MQIVVDLGPTIGDGMLFISLNLVAFLLSLILVLRIGTGKIGQPIFLIGLGFLFSGLIPTIFGVEYLWAVPLVQSLFSILGIIVFMKVLGIWEILKNK